MDMPLNKVLLKVKDIVSSVMDEGAHPVSEFMNGSLPPSQTQMNDFFDTHRLADVLPFEYYDEDTGLFYNDDSYGFMYELNPLTGADESVANIIAGLFTQGLPDGISFQYTLWGSPTILPRLTYWANSRITDDDLCERDSLTEDGHLDARSHNIYHALARRRVGYLAAGAHKSLLSTQPMVVRDYRLIVSAILPLPLPSRKIHAEREAVQLRKSMMGTMNSAGLYGEYVDANRFVDIMDDILNQRFGMEQKREPAKWDELSLLKNQVVHPDTSLQVGRDGMMMSNADVRCFSVRTYPSEWALWGMSELVGDFFQNALRIPCPFLFTANIHIPDQVASKHITKLKAARATQASESTVGRYVPVWHEKKREWDYVNKKVEEGHTLCRMSHQLILFAEPGQGEMAANLVKSLFKSKGWDITLDRFIQVHALLSALPFSLTPVMVREMEKLGRMRTFLTWTAANLLPIIGEWKGSSSPLMALVGRRGQLLFTDPYDNLLGNFNVAVAAASGAGKSFLVQEMALAIRGRGGRAWIIDVGRSYMNLARLIGGSYLEFGPESNINLNPFTHIEDWNDEGLPMLKPLLSQMASPSAPTSDIQSAFIEQGLNYAWEKAGTSATITLVADFLLGHDDARARDLGTQLYPYTKEGMYARFFEGPSTIKFDNPFVVLELGELNNKPDLQSVVVLILMMQIAQAMYLGDREVRKMCIIDEAWRLMSSGNAGEFIEEGYRVARKHGGNFVTITQGIDDYYKSDTAKAALQNADWVYLLRQKAESIQQLAKSDRLVMNDYMTRSLKSVETKQGQYSELMVYGPAGWTIGRLVVDPFTEKLYSTQAAEFQALESMQREQGYTLEQALEELVRKGRAR
jgi:conjugal transfer ATP-binding protein TraC